MVESPTSLKEYIPCLALNVRTGPQEPQVDTRPLVIGCPLEWGCTVVLIDNNAVNIVAARPLRVGLVRRDDIDFNGNGLPIDGNRRRVARVLPFRFARAYTPRR